MSYSFYKVLLIYLERREGREKERERNIDVREKYQSVASPTFPTQDEPRTQVCTLTRN